MHPAIPAMKAAIANASSFVPATLTPAAAAARSFDRTASIFRPRRERRIHTTDAMTIVATIRQNTLNQGFGIDPEGWPKTGVHGSPGPKCRPKIVGDATLVCEDALRPDWKAGRL